MILHSVELSHCLEIPLVTIHLNFFVEEVTFKKVEHRTLSYLPKH